MSCNPPLTYPPNRRPASSSQALLCLLVNVVKSRPASIFPVFDRYYRLLARYFEEGGHVGLLVEQQEVLAAAVSAPLGSRSNDGKWSGCEIDRQLEDWYGRTRFQCRPTAPSQTIEIKMVVE